MFPRSIRSKKVQLWVNDHFLRVLDEAAERRHQSRSDYIRESITLRINSESIVKNEPDEVWDDAKWQQIMEDTRKTLDEDTA